MTRHDHEAHLISISRIHSVSGTEVSIQRFRGAVREGTVDDFRSRLAEAGERSPYLVVDLSELDYVDASGLGHLLDQAAFQGRRGGWLRLVAPSPAVAMILRLSGVAETLPPAADEAEALRDLGSRAA